MTPQVNHSEKYIGLMSGTSLDGVDAVLIDFQDSRPTKTQCQILAHAFLPYPDLLRHELLLLHQKGDNELERAALLGNQLSHLYAEVVAALFNQTSTQPSDIQAIGMHGQTIRHQPHLGYTIQIGNPALLAELSGITTIADFRSRDIAANGQGAPLVPAFHQALFKDKEQHRIILNIGGIANLTVIAKDGTVIGFDSGPGNILMDAWINHKMHLPFDKNGGWAHSGVVIPTLLNALLEEPFLTLPPPKSTGRDLFNLHWLEKHLQSYSKDEDVQRTLLEFTAKSIHDNIEAFSLKPDEIFVCGGGGKNTFLMERLRQLLHPVKITTTDALGIAMEHVEAAAFAWLARQTMHKMPGNLPEVTGANGLRILGSIYH